MSNKESRTQTEDAGLRHSKFLVCSKFDIPGLQAVAADVINSPPIREHYVLFAPRKQRRSLPIRFSKRHLLRTGQVEDQITKFLVAEAAEHPFGHH